MRQPVDSDSADVFSYPVETEFVRGGKLGLFAALGGERTTGTSIS